MGKNGTQSAALGNPVVQELQKETAQRRAQTIAQIASGKNKGETPRASLPSVDAAAKTNSGGFSHSSGKIDAPTLGERLKNVASGAGKQYASGYTNLLGLGQTGTAKRMGTEAQETVQDLEREIANQRALLNDRNASEADRESARTMIESMEKKADAYRRAYGAGGENEKTAAKVYGTADALAESGAKDVQKAKAGLGKVGSLAVDVGVGGAQLGADILLGLPTGGALLPMALRSAGGAAQEARQEGATHEQQTTYGMAAGTISVLTEKLSNAAKPLAKAFGKGAADEIAEKAIASLAKRLSKTAGGRALAQGLLKTGWSALGEGAEEMAEDLFDVAAKRMIYDPAAEVDVGGMLYDGLVGGVLGGVLGAGGEIAGAKKARAQFASELEGRSKYDITPELTDEKGRTWEQIQAEKKAASEETAKDTYRMIAHDDVRGQTAAALNAYNKAVDGGKSVIIPTEIVEKYEQINADPLTKLKNVVKEFYEKHLKGQSVDVDINGGVLTVKFENDGMKKSVGWRMKPDKAATFEQLLALTENSEYAYSSANRDANEATSIPRFHYYMADAQIDGRHVPVKIQIRDINTSSGVQESHYYYHNLQNNKGNDSPGADTSGANGNGNAYVPSIEPSARTTAKAVESVNAIDSSIDTNIPQNAAGVNAQDMQQGARYTKDPYDIIPELTDEKGRTWEQIQAEKKVASEETAGQLAMAEKIAGRFGAELRVERLNNGAEGEYNRGVITIDPNAKNPVRQVLVHELTHHMETSGLYQEFSDMALRYVAEDMSADMDALKRTIIREYAEGGFVLDEDDATREIVAKFAESKLFQDERTVRRLLAEDRDLFERIYDWLRDAVTKLTGTSEEKFLRDAEKLYAKALRETGAVEATEGARQLYAGEHARTADLQTLATAQRMWMDGTDNGTIRQETGWFRGMDGRWRFETDDSGMAYHREGDVTFGKDHPEYAEWKGLGQKLLYGGLTEEETARLQEQNTIWQGERRRLHERTWRGNATLENIIDHDALFEAYPELRNVRVRFENMDVGKEGYYSPSQNAVVLNTALMGAPEDVIVHEVQHAIQEQEGFASGSSPDYWNRRMEQGYSKRWSSGEEMMPRELYRNTAGEIEARDAEKRRGLSAAERRAKMPDLGDENTVFSDEADTYGDYIRGTIDEETAKRGIGEVAQMEPVTALTGSEFEKGKTDLITQVSDYFDSFGNMAYNPQLGDIILNRKGVKDDMGHGIGRKKAAAFAAVPAILENGRVIDYQVKWKGRQYDTAVVAAPITIGNEPYIAGIVLTRANGENKFYVHEVLMEKGTSPFKTGESLNKSVDAGGDVPSIMSLLEKVKQVKNQLAAQAEEKGSKSYGRSLIDEIAEARELRDHEGKTWEERQAERVPKNYDITPELTDEKGRTWEQIQAERAAETDDGYMDALARDENLFDEPLTPSDRIYAMKLDELQTREAPPERSRTAVEKRDVDELAELYAAAANPVSTARDARFEVSEGLVKAKTAEERKTAKDRTEDARSFFMRKMVDAGDSVTRVAKATGDKYLYPYYNMARSSASAGINMIAGEQTDVTGKRVGKSLNDIFQPIRKLGDDYYNAFQLYLFDLHNADRMSLVTGENTAKLEAELALKDFDRNNPDVATLTEERLRRNASDADPNVAELAKERLRLLRRVNQADRMGNKPVFSYEVTADMSRERAARLLREHPEFERYRAEVRKYIDNLMQYRVDSGLMTQEDAAFLKRYYPNYVPTFRAVEKGGRGRDRRSVQVGKTVGRAEGGTQKLVPLHEALGKQTMSVVREGSKNRFGQRLLDDYMNSRAGSEARRYVRDAQEFDADFSAETFDQTDPTPRRENTFSVYKDGKKWDMTVDESMFDAVKALSPDAKESSVAVTAIRSANNLFKSLVTGYNPTFLVRNTIRDLQTAGLYSRDGKAFAQNYPLALKEIRTNGEYWKRYKALGGSFSSVFDYRTGTVKEQTGKAAKLLGRLEALNMATEQAPRLAEFMSVVKAGDGSMSNLMDAMHAAADVTVNFGRAGTLGKVLNANFVPFLNPGIQGFDKMIRRVTETQGAKEWASLVVRAAVLGIAPSLINAALYSDDKDWDDIRDSDKDTNYLFRIGDGLWLKVPKGRELSVLGMTVDRIGDLARGEDVDWGDFITTVGNQVAPANPLKSNIFSAYADADLFDPSSPGKTWYGGDIESQRLRKYAPGERYDSSTDVVSKWIGEQLGLSPKKINYLLDQYTGVVGDFVLPILTPQAERGMFEKAFTLDSVSNNRISGDFYDESDALTYAKNGGDDTAAVVGRFWSKQAAACAEVYAEIREVEESSLSDAEKKQKVREAKAVLNGIQKNALALEDTYRAAAERAIRSEGDLDAAYREANRECFGAEYALQVYNKDVYARGQEAHKGGVDYEDYYDYYFATKGLRQTNGRSVNEQKIDYLRRSGMSAETQAEIYCADIASDSDLEKIGTLESKGVTVTQYMEFKQATGGIEADRDANGKTISGSKKEKVLDAIDDMDLTVEQKDALYEAAGYSKSTLYSSAPWYDIRPNPAREVAKSARKSGTKTSDPLAKWSMDRYKLEPW